MRSKNLFLTFVVAISIISIGKAQVEIVPMYGTTFRATYYDGYNRIQFNQGQNYGGAIFISPRKGLDVGFTAYNQDSDAEGSSGLINYPTMKMGITHYQLSFHQNFPLGPKPIVSPYFGLDLGCSNFYKKGGDARLKASFGVKAGLKVQITEVISLRVQGQLQCPITGIGLGVGIGTGGASVGGGAYSSFIQFAINGGIGFTLGGKSRRAAPSAQNQQQPPPQAPVDPNQQQQQQTPPANQTPPEGPK